MMLEISKIKLYEEREFQNDDIILIKTKIKTNNIEHFLNNILDSNKYNDICKYYINLIDYTYHVSFKVGLEQLDAMIDTSFEIEIYKDTNNNSVIIIGKKIKEHYEWKELYLELTRELKKID